MKTAGQILTSCRSDKKLELEDIARVTKIRPQFLKLIEADNYQNLPSGTVARGFIRNYAEFLSLNPDHVLAVFRRDFVENASGQIVPRGMVDPVEKVSFWTPRSTIITAVVLLFTVLGAYLAYQFHVLTGPPPLRLDEPKDNVSTSEESILVTGNTDPEATVSVNGQLIALEKGGRFTFRLPLSFGPNKISVTATSKAGKATIISRLVNLTQDN